MNATTAHNRCTLRRTLARAAAASAIALAADAWGTAPPALQHEPIRPLPAVAAVDTRKAALGERLFHEPRLSRDGTVACASCHSLATAGTDRRARSIGLGGAAGQLNAPTVLNAAFNFRQFWDGRAATLEAQIDGPMQAANEMGASWPRVLHFLRGSPEYAAAFDAVYADGVTRDNVKNAIAEFERTLTTPNSRFDHYLTGDADAITPAEKSGYEKFKAYGCASCHQGVNVGGNMFQRMGVIADYFAERGNITQGDYGRYNTTGDEADRYVFKVPSLRNVELTPPYFHDGSAQTLEEAVTAMARYQLGRPLPETDLREVVLFLKTLNGVCPERRR
ncbi:MAG: cytochrome-c peroxidase [Gammaproteobacteria bacterium]